MTLVGDVYYENEDELDNFYNENGDQISRQAAASFGLDSRPRTSYPEQVMLLPTDRHTGQTVRGGSDFPYTHSQPGARAAERYVVPLCIGYCMRHLCCPLLPYHGSQAVLS